MTEKSRGDLYLAHVTDYAFGMKKPFVYILASQRSGTLYIGVTSNMTQRIAQHIDNINDGFTKKYCVHRLVWYEEHQTMRSAIEREKAIKKWNRAWKVRLIEESNPEWNDLKNSLLW